MSRAITYLPVADLTPDPRNPKDHDVGLIHTSVNRFGFVEPIVIDGRTGLIVSGHGRVKALQAMEAEGDPPPDGIGVDETTGRWHVPVVTGWESSSDADAAAALIAMNRTGELGGWIDSSLLDLLEILAADDSLHGIGYDFDDLEAMRQDFGPPPDFEPDESGMTRFDLRQTTECPNCGEVFVPKTKTTREPAE
jgi:hypothetical protein